jgi:hypothetical protein
MRANTQCAPTRNALVHARAPGAPVIGAQQRLGEEAHEQHAALWAHRAQRGGVEVQQRGVDKQLEEVRHVLCVVVRLVCCWCGGRLCWCCVMLWRVVVGVACCCVVVLWRLVGWWAFEQRATACDSV